jgi:hypothetical protein
MSDLKPLGSERLQGDEKLKRIMEIANYGRTPKQTINESSNVEYIKESTNGTYGIVKEKDGYYVKKGLNESSLDYIGGIFMKNKNKFSSYSEALKRLELISGQESLQEAKKYVLKTKSSEPVADEAPVEDVPAEPVDDLPVDDAPVDDLPPEDNAIGDVPAEEPEIGDEGEEGKRSDYMAEVQKFSGKLGQALRDVKEKMMSDDIKYVLNMVISAVDLDALDEEDREDIAEKFEPKDEESFDDPSIDDEIGDVPAEEPEMGDEEVDGEIDEIMAKLESFVGDTVDEDSSEELEEKSIEDLADLSVQREEEIPEEEAIEEIDLEELKGEINKHVGETLSKYFK